MKNIAIIALSVVLAAAVVFCLIFYPKYLDTKDALSTSEKELATFKQETSATEKKLSPLKEENIQLKEENSAIEKKLSSSQQENIQLKEENSTMKDRLQQFADSHEELTKAKNHIAELSNTVRIKDQALAEFEVKLDTLENAFEEKKKAEETLKGELSAKNAMVAGLQEELKTSQSNLLQTKDEVARCKSAFDNERKLKELALARTEKKLGNLENEVEEKKKTEETLKTELSSKEQKVTKLQEELETSQSTLVQIEDEIERRQDEIEKLRHKLLDLKGEKTLAVTKLGTLKSTYEALISDLKKQIEKHEVTIKAYQEKISVSFVDRILFEFGKASISYEGEDILRKVGGILKNVDDKQIRIIGHTDNIPILPRFRHRFPSNWELSAARAAAVVRYFQHTMELDPRSLEAVGRSYYEPVASNQTEEGRAQNRRVNIIIAPKIE
jgi:chemotaxis protein MotB